MSTPSSYEESVRVLEQSLDKSGPAPVKRGGSQVAQGGAQSAPAFAPSKNGQTKKQQQREQQQREQQQGKEASQGQQQGKDKGAQKEKPAPKKEEDAKLSRRKSAATPPPLPGAAASASGAASASSVKEEGALTQSTKSAAVQQFDDPARRKKAAKQQVVALRPSARQVALFSHLPQYERPALLLHAVKAGADLHPAVVALGVQYAQRAIVGSSARTLAMLDAFAAVVRDYTPSALHVLEHRPVAIDLEQRFRPLIQFLSDCRPLSVGMGNAIKHVKRAIGRLGNAREEEARERLLTVIAQYREQRIVGAVTAMVELGAEKLRDGDVLVTFGHSHVIERMLLDAHLSGQRRFRVVVVDAAPHSEGRTLALSLVRHGVRVDYALLTALAHALRGATKVLLGAHALFSNGALLARAGSAAVAAAAHALHVPVLVACETYKMSERVQLDAVTFNELEDPDELLKNSSARVVPELARWQEQEALKLLLLAYDLTPPEQISAVITELGLIPPTSVPVVLRELAQRADQ